MMPIQSIEGPPPHGPPLTGPGAGPRPGPGPGPGPGAGAGAGAGSSNGPLSSAAGSTNAAENGDTRQLKPKTLPCKYCSKRFRRVEHVQRHERTHTKEKPFSCTWDRCGRNFGRRDLLVRHEKLVHLNEGNKDNSSRPRKASSASGQPPQTPDGHGHGHGEARMLGMPGAAPQQPQYHAEPVTPVPGSAMQPDPRMPPRSAACNLDLLSDAALASEVNPMQPMIPDLSQAPPGGHQRMKGPYEEQMAYAVERTREDPGVLSAGFAPQPTSASFEEYNFLDDLGSSSHFLPPPFDPEQQFGMWPRQGGDMQRGPSKPGSQFPSRFPSLQPDPRDVADGAGPSRLHEDQIRTPSFRVTPADHAAIKNRVDEFSSALPPDFVFPSRHTLTRFLEGYISGFHENLPFLHLPTLSPVELAPELLLAMLAVGAQYRFESHRGHALWYAARAVALEQIRRRHSHEVHALLPTPAAYSPHSTRPSPSSGYRHSFASAQQDRPITRDTHREPFSPNTPQARLETIQAVLLLFAVGLWGAKAILHDALSLQSNLAMLLREEGLVAETSQAAAADWDTWIRLECATRTKLISYCFFNLCSLAYNMPPLLLTSELNLFLPHPSQHWRAESAWQWQEMRQAIPALEMTVHDAFSRLFGRGPHGIPPNISSLGNYVLTHALLQHIYLLRQTSLSLSMAFDPQRQVQGGIRPEDVEEVTHALRAWQMTFENGHQMRAAAAQHGGFAGDVFPGGPIAFNATALLRLAYLRLYADMVPSQGLETRDHIVVATALGEAPLLMRSLRAHRAVVQAVHALSMLVKAGVNYVARTKSSEWSIQHSFCNFECAVVLSKWLLTLSTITPNDPPATPEEKNLLETVRRMLDETEFAVPIDPSLSGPSSAGQQSSGIIDIGGPNDGIRIRQLASAVVRLWAETFKGSHIFEVVRVMGSSLDGYADLIEKPRDRTPLVRMPPEPGM